jgi:uncharacterized protein (DUF1330 family)
MMRYAAALSVLAGFAAGAAAIQGLHAQAKPPTYVVVEIDVQEPDKYLKEFAPLADKAFTDAGGKWLARTGPAAVITGTPPRRAALIAFENLDKARASFRTEAYKELRKTGQKHATFRVYALEGIPQ